MLVLIHIVIALSSLAQTTALFFSPTAAKFHLAYALIGGTLLSGTFLVISTHAPLIQACLSGLVYLSLASGGLILAHRKYALENS